MKKIKLSEIIARLEKRGFHMTAENVKKVVEGQDSPKSVVKELLFELIDGDFSELRMELEIAMDEAGLSDTKADKQHYKADKVLDMAEKEYNKLLRML